MGAERSRVVLVGGESHLNSEAVVRVVARRVARRERRTIFVLVGADTL